jgi:hypothetical protein
MVLGLMHLKIINFAAITMVKCSHNDSPNEIEDLFLILIWMNSVSEMTDTESTYCLSENSDDDVPINSALHNLRSEDGIHSTEHHFTVSDSGIRHVVPHHISRS